MPDCAYHERAIVACRATKAELPAEDMMPVAALASDEDASTALYLAAPFGDIEVLLAAAAAAWSVTPARSLSFTAEAVTREAEPGEEDPAAGDLVAALGVDDRLRCCVAVTTVCEDGHASVTTLSYEVRPDGLYWLDRGDGPLDRDGVVGARLHAAIAAGKEDRWSSVPAAVSFAAVARQASGWGLLASVSTNGSAL